MESDARGGRLTKAVLGVCFRRIFAPALGRNGRNASYETVIEGESYRQRFSPHRALIEGRREVIDAPDAR